MLIILLILKKILKISNPENGKLFIPRPSLKTFEIYIQNTIFLYQQVFTKQKIKEFVTFLNSNSTSNCLKLSSFITINYKIISLKTHKMMMLIQKIM